MRWVRGTAIAFFVFWVLYFAAFGVAWLRERWLEIRREVTGRRG